MLVHVKYLFNRRKGNLKRKKNTNKKCHREYMKRFTFYFFTDQNSPKVWKVV